MRVNDQDRAVAESRLRTITSPDEGGGKLLPPRIPASFQAFRASLAAQAPVVDPGGRSLRVLLTLGLAAAVVAGFLVWRSQPEPEPLPPPAPVLASASPRASSSPTSAAEVFVHVTGKVRRPGVYTLAAGSRVADAVRAAGGARPGADTSSVNLARRVVDGEQIVVDAPGAVGASAAADPASTVLNLNTATPDQLEQLPGVGEVLAQRIVEYRDAHGGFQSVEQLGDVVGIGPSRFADLKDKVQV
ncbi:ComEA family DNA-binding protein [Thermoactinospora rubra]|uniref:ComEA family DNA-binding protein n=1 Tax=Thermoactinospora rubra TaxID=1088767 RepID=UPI00197D881E|nr:ComEA family DNA-binding protein [Thermoactinospora rubra]